MTVHTIRLPGGSWEYDDSAPLGKAGGFGEVFRGSGDHGAVAVKRLKVGADQAAHRELAIGQKLMQKSLAHVVQVLDAGQDSESDRYFLVMPVCERSLQDTIEEADGAVDMETTGAAICAIIAGLGEVREITHRDLKPANVLLHEGTWKIADFGIAKFVEDSTSMETLRSCLTPAYAAPEQWKGERPSTATDVYALGCIIHVLIGGRPPFQGSLDDLREAHLQSPPETLSGLSPRFAGFVSRMLRKVPSARPTLERCEEVFSEFDGTLRTEEGRSAELDRAAKEVAEAEAKDEAERVAAAAVERERDELYEDAAGELLAIRSRLFARIRGSSESVSIQGPKLAFGAALLEFTRGPEKINPWAAARHVRGGGRPYQNTGWDVLGWSIVALSCRGYTWSASLLFCDRADGNGFRWYEAAFWEMGHSSRDQPYGLEGYHADIDLALGSVIHSVNVAYGPLPIDGEDEESFSARWIGLVAKASTGKLERPNRMPISFS